MSDIPTIYFPAIAYETATLKPVRGWSTEISKSPGGQRQKRSLMPYPLRGFTATIWVDDGSATYLDQLATLDQFRQFLNLMRGEWGVFWARDTKKQSYDNVLDPRETFVGLFDTTFPMICPFWEGTITNIYINGTLAWTTGQFTQDSLAPGGEVRIATVDTGVHLLPDDGDAITVDVTGAFARFAACLVGDIDAINPDFDAADPGWRFDVKVQEELVG